MCMESYDEWKAGNGKVGLAPLAEPLEMSPNIIVSCTYTHPDTPIVMIPRFAIYRKLEFYPVSYSRSRAIAL